MGIVALNSEPAHRALYRGGHVASPRGPFRFHRFSKSALYPPCYPRLYHASTLDARLVLAPQSLTLKAIPRDP